MYFFLIQDFLELAYFTKEDSVHSVWLLCFYQQLNSEKECFIKAFFPCLKLFCPSYPTKRKQALEEKN